MPFQHVEKRSQRFAVTISFPRPPANLSLNIEQESDTKSRIARTTLKIVLEFFMMLGTFDLRARFLPGDCVFPPYRLQYLRCRSFGVATNDGV
jgi:hypothetical protein